MKFFVVACVALILCGFSLGTETEENKALATDVSGDGDGDAIKLAGSDMAEEEEESDMAEEEEESDMAGEEEESDMAGEEESDMAGEEETDMEEERESAMEAEEEETVGDSDGIVLFHKRRCRIRCRCNKRRCKCCRRFKTRKRSHKACLFVRYRKNRVFLRITVNSKTLRNIWRPVAARKPRRWIKLRSCGFHEGSKRKVCSRLRVSRSKRVRVRGIFSVKGAFRCKVTPRR